MFTPTSYIFIEFAKAQHEARLREAQRLQLVHRVTAMNHGTGTHWVSNLGDFFITVGYWLKGRYGDSPTHLPLPS
jgi:hypothetical protein